MVGDSTDLDAYARWTTGRSRKVGAHTLHVHDRLTLALLPVSTFCSGHVFFTQHLPKRLVREIHCSVCRVIVHSSLSLALALALSRS